LFNTQSFFALVAILHLLCAGLLWEIYKKGNDSSARYWIYGCAAYALGLILIVCRPYIPIIFGFAAANFLLAYANILFGYGLKALSGKSVKRSYEIELVLTIYACLFVFLLEAEWQSLIPTLSAIGLIFTSLWAASASNGAAKKLKSAYLVALHYLFLGVAVAWLIRLPLAAIFDFIYVTDANPANWGTLMVYMCCAVLIQITYLVVRLSVLYQEKLNIAAIKQEKTEEKMLSSLNALSMARDNETGNHIIRTQYYVKLLALRLRVMGYYTNELSDQEIELLFRAAPLHDIGKVGIPDAILLKPGRLDEEEWAVMKTHTIIGESVLSSAEVEIQNDEDVIAIAIKIAGGHHEKWDGTGYPRNLRSNEIPLSARIMALADMYDALVSRRVYKKEWTHDEAADEIIKKRGSHFDPLVVDAFMAETLVFKDIAQQYRDD
jgi:hypothetical protein